jgi:hypothetical protein
MCNFLLAMNWLDKTGKAWIVMKKVIENPQEKVGIVPHILFSRGVLINS